MSESRLDQFRRFAQSGIGFGSSQFFICCALLFGGWQCFVTENHRPGMPVFNNLPREIRPVYDYPFVVSDQQLATVLTKLHPKFQEVPTKINFVDHAIRLWGTTARFDDNAYSGEQMKELLLDHDAFAKTWGRDAPALLQKTAHGISVVTQQGRASVSHVDHLMGTLAEIGMQLSCPINTVNGPGTVRDLLENAMLSFSLNQREYEWTALIAAFYTAGGEDWFSKEGQSINFDSLAKRIIRQQQPQGVCYGQHRLYSLTMLLRIDEQMRVQEGNTGLLTSDVRSQIDDYLLQMTRRFYKSQSAEGYWDGNWPDASKPVPDPETDALSRQVLATGHALEWWAMAPEKLHPPRETIVRAAQWLAKTIGEMDQRKIENNYTFLTHAARALSLWRGCFAAEFENRQRTNESVNGSADTKSFNLVKEPKHGI